MAESSGLASKARAILINPDPEEFATLVSQLFMPQETDEYKSAKALYDFFVDLFQNLLSIKLLQVYRSSTSTVVRFQSIYLLSENVTDMRNRQIQLSPVALHEIKPLLICCLKMKETKESDIRILRRFVSFVACNVMMLGNGDWAELGYCIFSLLGPEPLKAFHLFIELPIACGKFLDGCLLSFCERALTLLTDPKLGRVAKDWSLGFETLAKILFQLSDAQMRQTLMESVVKQLNVMGEKRMVEHMERGLEDLKKFVARNTKMHKFSEDQRSFVAKLAFEIAVRYKTMEQSKEVTKEILKVAKNPERCNLESGFDVDWYDYLGTLSSVDVLGIFTSTDLEERSRELAITRLSIMLSDLDNTPRASSSDHLSMMRELQPLLISCLMEEGLSESMFKILGEVVNSVACEMWTWDVDETWDDLVDYIAKYSKIHFQRAVYVFQCMTMQFDEYAFIGPVMDSLLPEISARLNPPEEFSVDNSSWVFAFTGAFCAIARVIEMPSKSEFVKEIAHKMVSSVKELVEREMEVGLVGRAFRDVESIVEKQLEWYVESDYKFIKGLLWRLYAIKGMKWESKIVLWRINVNMEREISHVEKEPPKNELDWINQPED